MEWTHLDNKGRGRMVEISGKQITKREAIARGSISMSPATIEGIIEGVIKKGDVLSVAQIAGIMGAKETSRAIPMCHPLFLTGVSMDFRLDTRANQIHIEAKVTTEGKTGVEMEALHAVSVAALTIYDMCKAVDKDMVISDIRLAKKAGGQSGLYQRQKEEEFENGKGCSH